MVPVRVAGNIPGEATISSGNIFNDAMRGLCRADKRCAPARPGTLAEIRPERSCISPVQPGLM